MFTGSDWRVDARLILALEIHVTLDPGTKVLWVERDFVFDLAGLDAAQAADAARRIDPECPAMLGPIVCQAPGPPRETPACADAGDAAAAQILQRDRPTPEQTAVVAHNLPSREMKPRRPPGSVIDLVSLIFSPFIHLVTTLTRQIFYPQDKPEKYAATFCMSAALKPFAIPPITGLARLPLWKSVNAAARYGCF